MKYPSIIVLIQMALFFLLGLLLTAFGPDLPGPTPTPTLDLTSYADVIALEPYIAPGLVKDVTLAGNYAYIAAGNAGLRVLDISDPAQPVLVGSYDTAGYATQVVLEGHFAYLADELYGLRIIDVSNPFQPVEVGFYDTPGEVKQVVVADDYAYVIDDKNLHLVNIFQPTRPQPVSIYTLTTSIKQVVVLGQVVYLATQEQDLHLISVSDPTRPLEIAVYQTSAEIRRMMVVANRLYAALGWDGLEVIDVAHPTQPRSLETYGACNCNAFDGVISGDYAYLSIPGKGLRILALSPALTEVNFYPLSATLGGLKQNGDSVYGLNLENHTLLVLPIWPRLSAMPAINTPTPTPPITPPLPTTTPMPERQTTPPVTLPSPRPTYAYNLEAIGHLGGKAQALFAANGYLYAGIGSELAVLDVSTPTQPVRIGYTLLPALVKDIYVIQKYAYLLDANRRDLWIIDVSKPTDLKLVSSTEIPGWATDIYVVGHYAYLATWERGLVIVDVSNPAAPVEVSYFNTLWWHTRQVVVANNHAYVAAGQVGLGIVDVSDPTQPLDLGIYRQDERVSQVTLVNNYLVLNEGQSVLDLSKPAAPVKVAYSLPSNWDKTTLNGYAYIIDEMDNVAVLDGSNPQIAVEVGSYITWNTTENLAVVDQPSDAADKPAYLYLVSGEKQHLVIDVSQVAQPTIAATYQMPDVSVLGLAAHDHYTYLVAGHKAVQTIDLAHSNRRGLGPTYTAWGPSLASDIVIDGDYAYVTGGSDGLRIYDISAGLSGDRLGQYEWRHFFAGKVAVAGDYAYVTGQTAEYNSNARLINGFSLRVVQITNPAHPVEVGQYPLSNWVWDLAAVGDYVYVIDGQGGLHILDISNPANPIEAGRYYLPDRTYQIALGPGPTPDSLYAYIAAGWNGLQVIDVTHPAAPTLAGFYQTATEAWDVALDGRNIYVADHQGGLTILQFTGASTPPPNLAVPDPLEPPFMNPENSISASPPGNPLPRTQGCGTLPSCLSPISPQEIVDRVERNSVEGMHYVWNKLGIEWNPETFLPGDYVQIQRIDIQPDTPAGPDVIVQFVSGWNNYYQFFARRNNEWLFLGYVVASSKYGSGEGLRLVTSQQGDAWIVISEDGGGTGAYLNNETWFWFGPDGPKPVLTYPVSGQWSQPIPYWKEFSGKVYTYDEASYRVEINYLADYSGTGIFKSLYDKTLEGLYLFAVTGQVHYLWQPDTQKFVLDPEKSDLTSRQIQHLFSWDEEVISPAFEQLLHLALTGDEPHRRWLRHYLNENGNNLTREPEERLLHELVN